MNILNLSVHAVIFYTLVLVRVAAVVGVLPFIGGEIVPTRVKALLSAIMALALTPLVYDVSAVIPFTPVTAAVAVIREVAIGVSIGFVVNLVFVALQLGGQIVGQVMGLGLANVINPFTEARVSVIGQFYFFFGILVFFALRGHHILIEGLVRTFEMIPPGKAVVSAGLADLMVDLMAQSFVMALKVAAPALVALFVVMLALGFIARTVPQLNILVVGFPLSIMIGLLLVALSVGGVAYLIENYTGSIEESIARIIHLMKPAPTPP